MKLTDIFEGDVTRFPTEKRGFRRDPVTGLWNRDPDPEKQQPEFWVVSGPDFGGKGYSWHPTYKEAEIAIKKLKLKGNREDLRIIEL